MLKYCLALGSTIALGAMISTAASAAPMSRAATEAKTPAGIVKVEYSCRDVRHDCARRFGWGTRAFYRCVRRHGC